MAADALADILERVAGDDWGRTARRSERAALGLGGIARDTGHDRSTTSGACRDAPSLAGTPR